MNSRHFILAVALTVSAGDGRYQDATVPVRVLSSADAELEHPFTLISGIRELSDGRLIVVDRGEKLVAVADFARGTLTRIGRDGSGPGEYSLPFRVFAAQGDTTIVSDLDGRLTKLDASPRYSGEVRMQTTSGYAAQRQIAATARTFTDAQGRMYREGGRHGRANCDADSVAIQRTDPRSAKVDTVAWFPVLPVIQGCGVPTGPFVAWTTWVVAPDGRISLVSPRPYQVTSISSDGTRSVGPIIAHQRVPVTNAEKQAYRDAYAASPPVAMTMSGDFTGRLTVSSARRPYREPEAWPAQKSPFENSETAVLTSPTGEIWVRKQLPYTVRKPEYDVIGVGRELKERVILPERSSVLGFGRNGVVYVVRKDEDDFQYLQRFRIR